MEPFSQSTENLNPNENNNFNFSQKKRNKIMLFCSILIIIIIIIILIISLKSNNIIINVDYIETEGELGNPLKGFVKFVNSSNKGSFPLSLEYLRLDLNKIFPEKNFIDVNYLENELESAKNRKVQLIIRIACDVPGKDILPLWAKTNFKLIPYIYKDNQTYYSLDYNNETLLSKLDYLLKQLGKKYDGDGRIAFWELGTYGHWGEYHMNYVNKTLQATDETKKKILKMNLKYFRKTLSLIRKPEEINKNETLGYYHDCFAGIDYDNSMDKYFNRTNTWEKPLIYGFGGEIYPNIQNEVFGKEEYIKLFEEDTFKYHPTFLFHNRFYSKYKDIFEKYPTFLENRNKAERLMGYNYYAINGKVKIEEFKNNKNKINISIKIKNKGVAPFYYEWKIYFGILKKGDNDTIIVSEERESNLNIKGIMPNENAFWDYNIDNVKDDYLNRNNNYLLGLRIPSPVNTYVKLSNKEQRSDGWFIISDRLN